MRSTRRILGTTFALISASVAAIAPISAWAARTRCNTNLGTYHYADGAAYVWADIGSTGTPLTIDCGDSVYWPIGFSFEFYGTSYDHVYVSSRGFLTFGSAGSGEANNAPIPVIDPPNNVIAPFWDDLAPCHLLYPRDILVQTVGVAPERDFIVTYPDVVHTAGIPGFTFQVILREKSNEILFNYEDLYVYDPLRWDYGKSATVGIENAAGTGGIQYSYNAASLHDHMAIYWSACTTCVDSDGDGWYANGGTCGQVDCNDASFYVNPGMKEVAGNGVDDNCNGQTDEATCGAIVAVGAPSAGATAVLIPLLVVPMAVSSMRTRRRRDPTRVYV